MKKRKLNTFKYARDVALGGIVISSIENAGGQGTNIGAGYTSAMSKPIPLMANVQGTGMVLKSLRHLKMPKMKGGKKRR